MKSMFKILIIMLSISIISCKKKTDDGKGEKLFINGKIYTVNQSSPWAEAMLIKDGKIISIGTNKNVEDETSEDAEIIDLKGKMMMPGIHDVHLHALEAASENFQFILGENVTDPENYATKVQTALNQNTDKNWIIGWGFDIYTALEATRPPREILDDISTTKPIAIMELTSHSIWVNSKALELAGITNTTTNPAGGVIMRETNGEANGLLIDNAGNEIIDLAIASIPNAEQNDYDGIVEYSMPELAKYGITSICDARGYWKRNHHLTWQKVADNDKLTARVNLGLWAYPSESDASQLSTLQSLYKFDKNSLLKINQIKLYSDGIIINTTSAMHDDYNDDLFNLPTNNGVNYFTEARIAQYISALEPTGFDFHIHAIGNRGVNEALNAISQSGSTNGRHRLTHVEYVDPADYSRFASLNVTADAQVAGDFTQPAHWHDNDVFISAALNNNNVPIKSLVDADARLTLSSDWDVSDLNPFIGMQNAVTRAPQNISLEEAIKAYTINPAYVMRQEEIVGSLEVGKEADFIILNQNLFEIDVNKIAQTKVLDTYLRGKKLN